MNWHEFLTKLLEQRSLEEVEKSLRESVGEMPGFTEDECEYRVNQARGIDAEKRKLH